MDFTIDPYVGAGQLRFGMLPAEVASTIGVPRVSTRAFNKDRSDIYDGLHLVVGFSHVDEKLNHLGFSSGAHVTLDGRALFGYPSALEELMRLDGEPYKYVGFIILLRLGMMVETVDADSTLLKTIVLFAKGQFDGDRRRFLPIKMA